jgi:glycosyltransferase involved in cell wall biosynthesis
MDIVSKKDIIKKFYFNLNNVEINSNVLNYYYDILSDKDFNHKNLLIWLKDNMIKKKKKRDNNNNLKQNVKEEKFKNIIKLKYNLYFEEKIKNDLLNYYYESIKNKDYSNKDLENFLETQFLNTIKKKNKSKHEKIINNKKNILKINSIINLRINIKLKKKINVKNNIIIKNQLENKVITKKIKKKTEKKLFILLPTFNRGQLVTNVIDQVIKQTSTKWKLLVINDGSEDEHSKIIEEYLSFVSNKQIEYIKNEKNIGLPKTLNKGIRKFFDSNEELFTWISDDNFYYNIFVEKLLKSKSDFTYSYWILNNNIIEKKYNSFINLLNWFGLGIYMWNKSSLKKIGFYNENLTSVEDYDFILRTFLFLNMDKISCIETVLMKYNNNTENSLTLKYKSKIRTLTINLKKFYNFIFNNNIDISKIKIVKGFKNRLIYDEKNKLIKLSKEYYFLIN